MATDEKKTTGKRTLTSQQREQKQQRDRDRRAEKKTAESSGHAKEVDPSRFDEKSKSRRLRSIYRLEKDLENAKVALELASANRRAAKARYDGAVESLEKEIREQRTGAPKQSNLLDEPAGDE